MAHQDDGSILTFGTDTAPVLQAPDTSGQVLTTKGAGALPAFEAAGGAWNLIGSTTGSNAATITVTGLTSTYKSYAIIDEDIVPRTYFVYPYMRLDDSSAIKSGSTDYGWSALDGWLPTNAAASNQTYEGIDQDSQIEMTGVSTWSWHRNR